MRKPRDVLTGPDVPPLGGVLDFMRLLWALDHGLQARSKSMLAALGVTGPQRLALRLIGRFPGISAGRLANVMHLHPSTLTGIVGRLEARRLIVRWPDPRDARRALFGLAAAGQRLNEDHAGTVEASVAAALATLPEQKLQAAEEVLAAVVAALGVDE
jgi:DNA-binding MarR family transcriptional regulator